MTNKYYQQIVVKIEVEEGADIQDVISECDINLNHDKITETEIIEVRDEWSFNNERYRRERVWHNY